MSACTQNLCCAVLNPLNEPCISIVAEKILDSNGAACKQGVNCLEEILLCMWQLWEYTDSVDALQRVQSAIIVDMVSLWHSVARCE